MLLLLSFRRLFCLLFCCTSLLALADVGQDAPPEPDVGLSAESAPQGPDIKIPNLTLTSVSGEPVIDGVVDETFWRQAHQVMLDIELYPERMAPAVVETRGYVAASRTHLYVAFIVYDPNPDDIRSAVRDHDASKEDDYVSIIIDPTGTLAKKYEFRVNPDGSLSDVLQDTISDRYIYDWDTEWQGAAQRTEYGYSVEIAIPATAIRTVEKAAGEQKKGTVILKRSYPRSVDRTLATFFTFDLKAPKNDVANSAAGSAAGGALSASTADDAAKAAAAGNEELIPKNLTVVPHYIYHRDESRDVGGDYEYSSDHNLHSAGFDAEYVFSTSEAMALTVNPNFTDVEADIAKQSINNPFTIFKPEKRRFFKSASEYYNTLIPTVYTRNIVSPRLGLSYIKDEDEISYGGFAISDRETEFVMPDNLGSDEVEVTQTSYSMAGRLRLSQGKRSYGAISTFRGGENYHNAVVGVDGLHDLGPDDKFRFQILASDTQYPKAFAESLCEEDGCTDAPPPEECNLGSCDYTAEVLRADFGNRMQGYALHARYKHDGPEGLYWVGYEETSPDYRSDLGFHRKADMRSINMAYGEKWYVNALGGDEGKSRIRAYAVLAHSRSYEYNDTLSSELSLWGEFRGSLQSVFRVGWRTPERAVNRINQASLETGDNAPLFQENYWQWYFEMSPQSDWKVNFDGRVGRMANADNLVLGDMIELKPKFTFRWGAVEYQAAATLRDFEMDNERLYKEQFLSLRMQYKRRHDITHRLLYLDDLTESDVDRWLGDTDAEEVERELEYTLIYKPNKRWRILTGVKLFYEKDPDSGVGDLTERELYLKVETSL